MFVNIETKRLLLKCIDKSDREFIFEEFRPLNIQSLTLLEI